MTVSPRMPSPWRCGVCATLAFSLVLLHYSPAIADEWWGRDKALHLGVSVGLGAASYSGLWLGDESPSSLRLGPAWLLAMLPGLAKELHDQGQPNNHFSGKDMLWDAVGALLGCGIVLVVDLLQHKLSATLGLQAAPTNNSMLTEQWAASRR